MTSECGEQFNTAEFAGLLTTRAIGRRLVYVATCSSTMDVAAGLGSEAEHGTLVLAECQTAGRGRVSGRVWHSRALGNVYASLVLRPTDLAQLSRVVVASSVAAVEACRAVGAATAVAKWPNDVWLNGGKLGGMLVDAVQRGDGTIAACLGLGVNVNEPLAADAQPGSPTSIRTALGRSVSREQLLAHYCNAFERYLDWETPALVHRYAGYDFLCGLDAIVVMPNKAEAGERLVAKAEGFTAEGFLRVRYADGSSAELTAAEVSVRLQ